MLLNINNGCIIVWSLLLLYYVHATEEEITINTTQERHHLFFRHIIKPCFQHTSLASSDNLLWLITTFCLLTPSRLIFSPPTHCNIRTLHLIPKENRAIIIDTNGWVYTWTLTTGTITPPFRTTGGLSFVDHYEVASNGQHLLTVDLRLNFVKCWEIATGQNLATVHLGDEPTELCAAFATTVLVRHPYWFRTGWKLSLWEVLTETLQATQVIQSRECETCILDENRIIILTSRRLYTWHFRTNTITRQLTTNCPARSIILSPDQKWLMINRGYFQSPEIWSTTPELHRVHTSAGVQWRPLAFSTKGDIVAVEESLLLVVLYWWESSIVIQLADYNKNEYLNFVRSCQFSPSDEFLITSRSRIRYPLQTKVWRVATGQCVLTWVDSSTFLANQGLHFLNADLTLLVVVEQDRMVRLVDAGSLLLDSALAIQTHQFRTWWDRTETRSLLRCWFQYFRLLKEN